jgi:hypothetical protein
MNFCMTINNGYQKYAFAPSKAYKNKRFVRSYFTSKVNLTFTINSVTLSPSTTTLCSLMYTERICFILFAASLTAFLVVFSNFSQDLPLLQLPLKLPSQYILNKYI